MDAPHRDRLSAHMQRHARTLHRIACGLGWRRDADDIVQTLYTRWWKRLGEDPSWAPPETHVELFVCARNVVRDLASLEARQRALSDGASQDPIEARHVDESLHAFERLNWILARMPASLAEVLEAALASGRNDDAAVARELGLTRAAFTMRLFKARRAAEELAASYDALGRLEARRKAAS
jgi:DNA-directed RNA polymerase specialized sigma24 family protein